SPYVFFFQAEDGIRDLTVTGVQTCALPILRQGAYFASSTRVVVAGPSPLMTRMASSSLAPSQCTCLPKWVTKLPAGIGTVALVRSEERRVGKECRSRWRG